MAAVIQLRRAFAEPHRTDLHRDCANAHAVTRSAERCVRPLGYADVMRHEAAIREGLATRLGKSGNRRLHRVEEDGQSFFAVWCAHLQCIVTYLRGPHEWRGKLLTSRRGA